MSTAVESTKEIAEVPSFNVTLFVRRFNPETDTEPKWQDFDVQELKLPIEIAERNRVRTWACGKHRPILLQYVGTEEALGTLY